MFPKDVIENSLLALNTTSSSSATGYSGTLPTGRYLAPTNTLECIQYTPKGYCPGTSATLFITGPWFGKLDMSFVKRITARKNMRIEARMDLYNILDSNNFFPRYDSGSTLSGWEINSAARDLYASQDAGGRITSFGLRFSW